MIPLKKTIQMKNKLFRISLALFAALGMLSCDVEPIDDGLGGQDLPTNDVFFAANYGSVNYKTDQASAKVEGGILQVQAVHPNGVFLIKNQGALTGTYVNGQTDFTFIEAATGKTFSSKHPITGENISTFSITSINFDNQSISGTFQFVGYRMADTTIPDTDEGAQARMDLPDGEFPDLDIPDEVMPGVEQVVFSQGTMLNIPYGAGIIDPVDPNDPVIPVDPVDPNEPSSGDYFPMAVGNIWNYTNNAVLELGSSQVINGKTYYKQTNTFFADLEGIQDAEEFLRKENGNYYSRISSVPGAENVLVPQEIVILKDNLAAGGTWTSTIVLSIGEEEAEAVITITLDHIIEQKNVSAVVNGVTYQDVIKVKSTNTSELSFNGEVIPNDSGTTISYHWFAKDVGMIMNKTIEEGEADEVYDLISYTLN